MDRLQLEAFLEPISAESPCGPDLELDGEADFSNVLARAESLLPGQFFQKLDNDEERPFARGSKNFEPELLALEEILKRSRDVRPLVLLAKFHILDRKLPDFVDAIDLLAQLAKTRWEDLNPKSEDGDFAFRLAALQALDDRAHVLLPLQFTPLIRHARAGVITWRSKILADGVEPMPGEIAPEAAGLRDAFMDVDLAQLVEQRDHFARLGGALDIIRATTEERVGHVESADLPLLRELCGSILAYLEDFVARRDPNAALAQGNDATDIAPEGADASPSKRKLDNVAAVAASLSAVADYFHKCEPSNPALLLVRQATLLVGKTFAEVMRILLPDQFDAAVIEIGRAQRFGVSVSRLADDAVTPGCEVIEAAPAPIVDDRRTALLELQKIEAFYADREPTSPIPFFCERARKLTEKDFLSILNEILPENVLKTIEIATSRPATD